MDPLAKTDCTRRRLIAAVAAAGGFASGMALVPFVAGLMPSERANAGGAPVEVDIGALAPGESILVQWAGEPVWVIRRSAAMLASLRQTAARVSDPNSARSVQPNYCRNETRSIRPGIFVVIGTCTHLGCSTKPTLNADVHSDAGGDLPGGFVCPCHGSTFDVAGRVFKNKPAPDNLRIPPYEYLADTRIVIGKDAGA